MKYNIPTLHYRREIKGFKDFSLPNQIKCLHFCTIDYHGNQ